MRYFMTLLDRLALFTGFDLAALGMLFGLWMAVGWRIEHATSTHPSTSLLMADYRRAWMKEMVTRQPRVRAA